MDKNKVIKVGTKHVIFVSIILVVVVFLFSTGLKSNAVMAGNAVNTVNTGAQGIQEVTLSMDSRGYVMTPDTLKKDVPVRMKVDLNKVSGCMRDVVIPSFRVRKQVSTNDNVIEFTPTKKGVIAIRCSMNMGRGSFTVV